MKTTLALLRDSAAGLRRTRTLTTLALLIALSILLSSITFAPTSFLKIKINFLITAMMGYLFGPVPALLGAGMCDILGYLLRPDGPYFFPFTLCSALGGLIYGLMLYQRPIKFLRMLLTKGLISLFVNVIGNTLCLSLLYGQAISVLLPARLLKNLAALPVEAVLLTIVLTAVEKIWSRTGSFRS